MPYIQIQPSQIARETAKAVLICGGWLPKSQIMIHANHVVSVADWLLARSPMLRRANNPAPIPAPIPANTPAPLPTNRVVDPNLTVGAYKFGDDVFVLRMTKKKTTWRGQVPRRIYAMQMIAINGERLMLDNSTQRVDFRYNDLSKNVIFKLTPDHKLPLVDQESITIRYGRCLICARGLKDATSVKDGIGPICYENMTGIKRTERKRQRARMAHKAIIAKVSARESMITAMQNEG